MMSALVKRVHLADQLTLQHCRSWLMRDCGTIAFTPRRFVPLRVRRCYQVAIITPFTTDVSQSWRRASLVTTANGPEKLDVSRKFFRVICTPRPLSESGTTRPIT